MSKASNVKTLVTMQLKDKLDMSFLRSKRSTIIKVVLSVVKFAAIAAVFFLLFYLCTTFKVFSFSKLLPDTVLSLLFTVIEIFAIISCTVGLTNTLYTSLDNRVLLTMPVTNGQIFVSKLILYYVFEAKRNVTFTLPMFLAYGIINGAVWYYYLWMLVGFLLVSLIPVLVGAILSMPALFVSNFVRRHKWMQYALITVVAAAVVWLVVALISLIPENINIMGQWGEISMAITRFLESFKKALIPFYYLCAMIVGGTLRISTNLFGLDTLLYLGVTLGVCAVLFVIAYFSARPLFFKMASKHFEHDKNVATSRGNKVFGKRTSPYFESALMQLRSSRQLITLIVGLVLPFVSLLFLNKVYASMNTSYAGAIQTKAFNILVLLVTVMAFNNSYATVYSKEANARNLLKTRPVNPLRTLIARISLRALVLVLSVIMAIVTYGIVAKIAIGELIMVMFVALFAGLAHLLWAAELDVMHNQADQYQTIGDDFNNPNETKATALGFVLAAVFALLFFFLKDRGVTASLVKVLIIAATLFGARVYLFVTRVKLYFVEN